MHHFIASTLLSGVQLRSLSPPGRLSLWKVYSRSNSFIVLSQFQMAQQTQARLSNGSCYYRLFQICLASRLFSQTSFGWPPSLLCCCCCWLPDPFRGMGAWRNTMEPQKPGNSPGSGPEVVKRPRVAKE